MKILGDKFLSKKIAFGYYGGKYSHLDWLLPLLPQTKYYCEPFGGSLAVLLNREPSEVETYNDIYEDVVNFFTVLRKEKERFIEFVSLIPFSRREFGKACENKDLSNFDRAVNFYVRARQVRSGLAQKATIGRPIAKQHLAEE